MSKYSSKLTSRGRPADMSIAFAADEQDSTTPSDLSLLDYTMATSSASVCCIPR